MKDTARKRRVYLPVRPMADLEAIAHGMVNKTIFEKEHPQHGFILNLAELGIVADIVRRLKPEKYGSVKA